MAGPDDLTGRILLVEDDDIARAGLARSLRALGHVVAEASDAAQALEWMGSWPPDMVLLDRFLPDGDGLALLSRIKGDALTRDVPVVLMTTAEERAFVVEGLRSGAYDYLTTPFVAEEVHARTQAALRTKALLDELRALAAYDPLTGLRNPRGVTQQLSTWRAHCRRHNAPVTVAMLDITGLKRVNEEHSYEAGDRVLRAVAEQLQACVRAEDVVGRWGGDEFLVLLPRADASTAVALVERVNTRLAGQQLLPDRPITLRAGVAVAGPSDTEDDEHLLGRAAVSLLQRRGPARQLA
jgi:diguanylate cyclase (GGDEF)-like protein